MVLLSSINNPRIFSELLADRTRYLCQLVVSLGGNHEKDRHYNIYSRDRRWCCRLRTFFHSAKFPESIFTFSFGSAIKGSGVVGFRNERCLTRFTGVDVGGVFEVEITAGKNIRFRSRQTTIFFRTSKQKLIRVCFRSAQRSELSSQYTASGYRFCTGDRSSGRLGSSKVTLSGVKNSELGIHTSGASKLKLEGETSELMSR